MTPAPQGVAMLSEKAERPGDQSGAHPTEDHQGSGIKAILAEVHDNADSWWRDCAWRALEWLAEAGYPFTAYDLSELGCPPPDHPARWGALFRAAAKAGLIECVGFTESRRPSRSGGVCRVWRGVPKAEAS